MSIFRKWELFEDFILYMGSTFTLIHKHFLYVILPNICSIFEIILSTHINSGHDVQIEKGDNKFSQLFCLCNKD